MRCLFCKMDTDSSEPIEHILPESLGNHQHVLKRGVVCGKCNNYFASKVEKPFLEDPGIMALRFHEAVPSKKGRIPKMQGILLPSRTVVDLTRDPSDGQMSIAVPSEGIVALKSFDGGRLIVLAPNTPEPSMMVSRFLAKVGLEALAARLDCRKEWLSDLVDKPELEGIRNHARYGKTSDWPISIRSIYDSSTMWSNNQSSNYQIVHEFDFLCTEENEIYFILAIFGQEFVINMGGSDLEGWYTWLKENKQASPLQYGKNANVDIKQPRLFDDDSKNVSGNL